jgi:hypothetical protein
LPLFSAQNDNHKDENKCSLTSASLNDSPYKATGLYTSKQPCPLLTNNYNLKELFPMQSQDGFTEVTFYYVSGSTESYEIPVSPEAFQQQLQTVLNQPWLTLHLFDRTVLICTAQVTKVEVKPPILAIQGEGVFPDAQRVTALTHGAKS